MFPSVSATISESDVFGVIKTRADPLLTSIIHDPGMFLEGICKLNSVCVQENAKSQEKCKVNQSDGQCHIGTGLSPPLCPFPVCSATDDKPAFIWK